MTIVSLDTSNGLHQFGLAILFGYNLYADNFTHIYLLTNKHEIKVKKDIGSPKNN